jgi:hypothetical protein
LVLAVLAHQMELTQQSLVAQQLLPMAVDMVRLITK